MNAVQGELITGLTAGAATQIILTDVDRNEKKSFYLTVVSGTVKYGVNGVHANAHGWTAEASPISCLNGELYVKAAAATDTFVITAV